ncbi:MAG: dipeptidase [Intestinibacter sp.]
MSLAQKLLDESIVVDTHLDLLFDIAGKHEMGRKNVIIEDYLESFREGKVNVIVSSIFIDSEFTPDLALKKAMDQISYFYQELDSCNGEFVLATCMKDILDAKANGQLAIMLAFEGVEPLSGNPAMLRAFYELGVRIVGTCWSRSNFAADGSRIFDFEYEGYGLTKEGVEIVKYAIELGMLVDVSHTNEKTFWDIIDILEKAGKPVMATHSNCRALSDTPRNLSDEQIKAIHKLDGVIGINGASLINNFKNPKAADMQTMVDHILHEKELCSMSIACVGLDQCDRISEQSSTINDNEDLKEVFDIIPSHAMLGEFIDKLLENNFSEEDIQMILGKNVLRVIEKSIG